MQRRQFLPSNGRISRDPAAAAIVGRGMRLENQNRRGCVGLLLFLALVAAAIAWMSFGGVPGETVADDVEGPVDAVPPPRGKAAPAGTSVPQPPARAPG